MTSPEREMTCVKILAGCYFDSYNREFIKDHLITLCQERGIILDVCPISPSDAKVLLENGQETVIDLRKQTVLPGFVDAHVHFFLHPYSETSWEDQLTKESIVERTVRAVTRQEDPPSRVHHGGLIFRDLGTEGAGDADISLRKCLSGRDAIIPGPRYFCANRALVSTGSYGPKGVHHLNIEGVEGITGAEVVDGKDECRKAVRRQIGAGADWIKIYADYRVRSRMESVAPELASRSLATFIPAELEEIISTATSLGAKTAIHLTEDSTFATILAHEAPHTPHSIEHGSALADSHLKALHTRGIFWVPTLAAYHTIGGEHWAAAQDTFRRALRVEGLKIACGGDTGVFAHGANALELKLMVRLGAEPSQVLQWATLSGWECVRGLQWEGAEGRERLERAEGLVQDVGRIGDNDLPFGAIRKGFAADMIGTDVDPKTRFEEAVDVSNISFVMKGGRIFKRDGQALC